jgi:hypothetical protein
MKNQLKILLMLFTLIITTLACTVFIGGPDYPETRIPVSTEAVDSFRTAVAESFEQGKSTGNVALIINQEQLTSLLAQKLQAQSDPFITDPQVYLKTGGIIEVYGRAHQGNFEATVGIVMTTIVNAAGQPEVQIVSADFGPLKAPEGLNKTINALLQETLTGSLGPAATGFRLESIVIADGLMLLAGRVK